VSNVVPMRPRARCGYLECNKALVRRNPGNVPAFCCYQHGVEGQPQFAKATRRNTGDGQDPAA